MERSRSEMSITGGHIPPNKSSSAGLGRRILSGSSLLPPPAPAPPEGQNISSISNVSINTSQNLSGPVPGVGVRGIGVTRRKSRFGTLARSLLTSESTDNTLSPNSVRGMINPFRSQFGLPPLEVSRLTISPEVATDSSASPPFKQPSPPDLTKSSELETDSSGSPPFKQPTPPAPMGVPKSSESEADSSGSPTFKVPTPPTPSTATNTTPPMPELSQVQTPIPPDHVSQKPPYTPINRAKMPSRPMLPPPLYSTDQNVPPRIFHSIAAVVPARAHPAPMFGTPVGSKSFCPPPPPPTVVPPSNKIQRSIAPNRTAKKPNSGWRFATENVKDKEYLIMKQIGKGGCGEVSLVMEKETRELFALKKVNLIGLDQRGIEECINEIKLLVELKDTDLVIHIETWEMNPADKTIKIVMEFGQCDLSKSISSDKIHSLNQIKSIWERILVIVQSIHQRGIVHADLKPANFVWVGGNLKIIDFGIANKLQADYTSIATLHPKGTLNFISPETVNQDAFGRTKISPKSDIWSLGCILHLMIFGRTPFQNITHQMAKINAIIHGVPAYPPLPPQFQGSSVLSVLQLCFQLDPKLRPTASQLLSHPFLQDRTQEFFRT